jgi:hypothetical protein
VPEYRIFSITDDDHIAGPAQTIECEDDREAVEKARQFLDENILEIWEQARRVARLEPN